VAALLQLACAAYRLFAHAFHTFQLQTDRQTVRRTDITTGLHIASFAFTGDRCIKIYGKPHTPSGLPCCWSVDLELTARQVHETRHVLLTAFSIISKLIFPRATGIVSALEA